MILVCAMQHELRRNAREIQSDAWISLLALAVGLSHLLLVLLEDFLSLDFLSSGDIALFVKIYVSMVFLERGNGSDLRSELSIHLCP